MILQNARLQTLKFLDDVDGQRWALETGGFEPSNEVDLALEMAANECIALYAGMGGDFFDVVLDVSTSGGVYSFEGSLSGFPNVPMMIQSVSLKEGSSYFGLRSIREQDIEESPSINRTLKVRVVFSPNFTGTAAINEIPLSRPIGGSQLPWSLFDQWICAVAAKHLTPKENEDNKQLDERIMMLRDAAFKSPETPLSVSFPRSTANRSPGAMLYRWSYVARDAVADKLCALRLHKISFL